jgi:integrase
MNRPPASKTSSTELAELPRGALAPSLQEAIEHAGEYLRASRAEATLAAYQSDWKAFQGWIEEHGLTALPADPRMVALYLSHLARVRNRKASTVKRALAALAFVHRRAGHPSPSESMVVMEALEGIKRVKGIAPKQAAPLLIEDLEPIVKSLPDSLIGVRDRALILVGWIGGFRASELVALRLEDIQREPEGLVIRVRRSKTDQVGEGAYKAVFRANRRELCPVDALDGWLRQGKITEGHVFRAVRGIRVKGRLRREQMHEIVQVRATNAGLQPRVTGTTFSAHSLRAGFVTQADLSGRSLGEIMAQTHHRDVQTVRGYLRARDALKVNAAKGLL